MHCSTSFELVVDHFSHAHYCAQMDFLSKDTHFTFE